MVLPKNFLYHGMLSAQSAREKDPRVGQQLLAMVVVVQE
jgi:hypothetical protein